MYIVKNWDKFQHYKKRRPAWVKLYHSLLDDVEFIRMPMEARGLAVFIWLLASEDEGCIDMPDDDICFRFRMKKQEFQAGIKGLIKAGFVLKVGENQAEAQKRPAGKAEKPHSGIPSKEEWLAYCREKGFGHIGEKSYSYYHANDFKDNQGRKIKSWKQKLVAVWFDEDKNPAPVSNKAETPVKKW